MTNQDIASDWEHQRAFLAVLQEGSLSGAARALQVAQPTVRRRLDALERTMGVALFTRSPGGLSPTDAARELAVHAQAMAAAANAFARAASADNEALSGTVRITASDVVGVEVLPGLLTSLQQEQPGLVFELSLTNRNEDLLRQEADIAIRMVRPTQDAMVASRVGTIALGFYAHPSYVQRHGAPENLKALAQHRLIGPDKGMAELRALAGNGLELRRNMFSLRTDSQLAQLAAIRAGLGIGLCQRALAKRLPELQPVLAEAFSYSFDTWVVMHEDLRRVRRVRATFSHLVDSLTAYCVQ